MKVCQKFATDNGYSVIRVFEDAGKSARSVDRDGFLDMVEFCKNNHNKIQAVIVYDTSRFARNRYDAMAYKKILKSRNIKILYASQNINPDDDSGFLVEGMLELFDEHYSRVLGRVTLRGMIENAKRGYQNGAKAPYGYNRVPVKDEKGNPKAKLEVNEVEALVVRKMFDQAIEGHGLTGNVRCLIDANIKDRRGKNFARSTVAKILQDQTYIGNTVFNRRDSKTNQPKDRSEWVIVQGTHPGIIPESIFQEAQKSIENRSPEKTNGRVFQSPRIFSELLYCKECGGKLTADTAQGRSRKYSYYTCRNRRFGKKESCVGIRVSAPELDSALLKNILSRIFSKSNLRSCLEEWNNIYKEEKNKGTGQKIKIQKALQKIETKRQNLVDAIANGVLNPDDVKETMAKIREDRCKLEIELAQLNRSDVPQFRINDDFIESVRKSFIEMVNVEKPVQTKTFIRKFVKGVDVSSDEVKINYILPDVKAATQDGGGRGSYSRPSWLRLQDLNLRQGG